MATNALRAASADVGVLVADFIAVATFDFNLREGLHCLLSKILEKFPVSVTHSISYPGDCVAKLMKQSIAQSLRIVCKNTLVSVFQN